MFDIKFIKAIIGGIVLATAIFTQAWAECATGYAEHNGKCLLSKDDCGDNCRWFYDEESSTIFFSGEGRITKGGFWDQNFRFKTIKNMVVEEGITGATELTLRGDWATQVGTSDGILKLPSTFKTSRDPSPTGGYTIDAFYNAGFGTVEIAKPSYTDEPNLILGMPNLTRLIIDPSDNLSVGISHGYGDYPETVTVECKGDKIDKCASMVTYNSNKTQVSVSYYKDYDSNGNIIEEWDVNGKHEYKYILDGAGNITAAYKDGIATYKRTSYTPAEAAAAANRGDKNTIKFTFK